MESNKNKRALVEFTDIGLYVPQADVYLDPWRPVTKAIISHAHSDHARHGHKAYACTNLSVPIMKYRLGDINVSGYDYGQAFFVNGVKFSFHPAGHVIGSAMIRVEYQGEVWLFTGDYKLEDDKISSPCDLVTCHALITESTFGLPIYQWQDQSIIFNDINEWWQSNAEAKRPSIITAYALGKAQRILNGVDYSIGPVLCHGAIHNTNEVFINQGLNLKSTKLVNEVSSKDEYQSALIVCPSSAINGSWGNKFKDASYASASGWMAVRGNRRRRGVDVGFVLSDHVDWPSLNTAVEVTKAQKVLTTHGYSEIFSRWLNERGIESHEVKTDYGDDTDTEDVASNLMV